MSAISEKNGIYFSIYLHSHLSIYFCLPFLPFFYLLPIIYFRFHSLLSFPKTSSFSPFLLSLTLLISIFHSRIGLVCVTHYFIFPLAFSYSVICSKDNITVIIGRHKVSSLDLDNMHLADSSCKASYNRSHVFITTAFNECGTTYSETEQQMFYTNTLTGAAPISHGSVITRKQSFAFKFKCAYSRLISVSGLKFQPPKPVIEIKQSK